MTSKHLARLSFLIVLISIGCNYQEEEITFPQEGFYVFGRRNLTQVYWQNGKAKGIEGHAGFFADAAIHGSDVYAIGYVNDEKTYRGPAYWKNGEMFKLSKISANQTPTVIAFAGSDMYIAGFEDAGEKSFPIYWKNGELKSLPGNEPYSRPTGIAVSGTDVHIVGQALNKIFDNDTIMITHWKNGERMKLNPSAAHEMVEDVAVSGNDIYFAGYTFDNDRNPHAQVWKNGVVTALANGTVPSSAWEVEVDGSDVYIAGRNELKVVYWKNGVMINVETGANRSEVSGLVVVDSQPVISGRNFSDYYIGSFLWKEGTLQTPFTGTDPGYHIDCIVPAQ